jgi:hypothetical protein
VKIKILSARLPPCGGSFSGGGGGGGGCGHGTVPFPEKTLDIDVSIQGIRYIHY